MIFWDSSAITPLLANETETADRERHHAESTHLVVWWGTKVECISALQRKKREGVLNGQGYDRAMQRLERLSAGWHEVAPDETVRERAERILGAHPLRAADALQLAAALVACSEKTAGSIFRTADSRLAAAAAVEGFTVE